MWQFSYKSDGICKQNFFTIRKFHTSCCRVKCCKSLFSDNTPASVSLLRSVDLPALVYPTIAATGVEVLALLLLWTSLCSFISLRSTESFDILSLISRLSVSIFFSQDLLFLFRHQVLTLMFQNPQVLLNGTLTVPSQPESYLHLM